jgi:hypothetical protein
MKEKSTTGGVDWKKMLINNVPQRMRHLRRDHRGYPWPFLMMNDSIVTMDCRKQERCVREKLCMICGRKLDNKKWFIGGHRTAINRLVVDPAMHEECARYSMKVCPFLANQDMKYRKKYDEDTTLNVGVAPERNETQCLMRTNGFKPIFLNGQVFIFCNRWDHIEHWRNGQRVSDPQGYSLADLSIVVGACDPGGLFHRRYSVVEV